MRVINVRARRGRHAAARTSVAMASTVEKIGQRVRAVVAKRTVAKRAVAKREEPRRVRASQVSGGHNNPGGKVVLKVGVGTRTA